MDPAGNSEGKKVCGLAGIVYRGERAVERDLLSAMTDRLIHRGPDASGYFFHENVGLGHRRLSIIDTSAAANQPLFNEDRSVAVIANGEIYNFRELRPELEALGHTFTTGTDCEVIVHAWEEYGTDCVDHFRGMYAFAIYDVNSRKLFLARDRLGKKPLFYSLEPDRFVFASEIKGILELPDQPVDIDLTALTEYTAYGNSLGERTIYKSIRKLPPGHSLFLTTTDSELTPRIDRYWDLRYEVDPTHSEEDWLDELDQCLSEAVRLRMISDVPLGAFLSGGIDSSLVTAYMAQHSSKPVLAVSMGFRERSYDESRYAAAIAEHLGADHHIEMVTPDAVRDLPKLIDTYDEPFADPSAIPTYHLCEVTRRSVTVALSGDGGDENFLGYPRYRKYVSADRIAGLITPLGRSLAGVAARGLAPGKPGKRGLERLSLTGFDRCNHELGYSEDHLSLLTDEVRESVPTFQNGKMAGDYFHHANISGLERCQYNDIMNYLPEDILVKVDRASMAHSLEVRCPLLDQEVVELAARIPTSLKLAGRSGKAILKRLVTRYIPWKLLNRPKSGFSVPLRRWFKKELRPQLDAMLADECNPMWQYFDRGTAKRRADLHVRGKVHAHTQLWRLLFFYYWANTHLR